MKKAKSYSAQFNVIQRSCPPVQNHPNEIENNKNNKNKPNSIPKKNNKTKPRIYQ